MSEAGNMPWKGRHFRLIRSMERRKVVGNVWEVQGMGDTSIHALLHIEQLIVEVVAPIFFDRKL